MSLDIEQRIAELEGELAAAYARIAVLTEQLRGLSEKLGQNSSN